MAIALAFARLAAMAAAMLVFFAVCGVVAGNAAASWGSGHAFSSCLRASPSRDSSNARPRPRQTCSKTQKVERTLSLTPGFVSFRALFITFSIVSSEPVDSITCFDR